MMEVLEVKRGQLVFDPFCGTGTTLVECMKNGIDSVGLDASPFSCFISRVKTGGAIDGNRVLGLLPDLKFEFQKSRGNFEWTDAYNYIKSSGMLERRWIDKQPLRDTLALRSAIKRVAPTKAIRDLLLVVLISDVSTKIGNMRYGPEIYRGRDRRQVDVWKVFQASFHKVVLDLEKIENKRLGRSKIIQGDARICASVLRRSGVRRVHAAISSPPYPTEHDYTRNTRLELALLDFVTTPDCVREIKQDMIRSHTKGIYKTDQDAGLVRDYKSIQSLAEKVQAACRGKTYGFARLYPTVVREYFGGMKRHFESMACCMPKGARYALVVGDQASYFGIDIPTAKLLGEIAQDCGFEVDGIVLWRERWATKTSKMIKEHALILKKTKSLRY
jgi:DNA modification methylase